MFPSLSVQRYGNIFVTQNFSVFIFKKGNIAESAIRGITKNLRYLTNVLSMGYRWVIDGRKKSTRTEFPM